jgi:hypothetical protein
MPLSQLPTSAVADPINAAVADPKNAEAIFSQVSGKKEKIDIFMILFLALLEAMQKRQDTVVIQSKEIKLNADMQQKLNDLDSAIKFSIIPSKATTAEIDHVQEVNQQYAAMRQNIENELLTIRQTAQVTMTQATTNIDMLQQDTDEDSAWLKVVMTVFTVINEMNKNIR